jgi:hypothetical protein
MLMVIYVLHNKILNQPFFPLVKIGNQVFFKKFKGENVTFGGF